MHPSMTAEIARLHRLDLSAGAAAHRESRKHRPATPAGDRSRARARLADGIHAAQVTARQHLGRQLIRAGMRMVDPAMARGAAE